MDFKNLDKVKFLVNDATGLEIMYAYDDLVFSEHGVFIIQFDKENENNYICYFHKDCDPKEQSSLLEKLTKSCKLNNCTLKFEGNFVYNQKGEEVEIIFT